MIRQLFFVWMLLFGSAVCAQVTGLTVRYSIGYDCSQEAENEDGYARGGCYHEQRLDYKLKRELFRVKEMRDLRLFREYDHGFRPNSIQDSLHVKRLRCRRRLPAPELERLLAPIIGLQSDSILCFNVADFSSDKQLLSVARDSIVERLGECCETTAFSTVTAYLDVSFALNGVAYRMHRDSENHFWTLRYLSGETEFVHSFIDTEFDAFLTAHFPRLFEGSRMTSNRKLEKNLSERAAVGR